MFGMFKKGSEAESDGYDPDQVIVHYEGEVMSPDYIADTLSKKILMIRAIRIMLYSRMEKVSSSTNYMML